MDNNSIPSFSGALSIVGASMALSITWAIVKWRAENYPGKLDEYVGADHLFKQPAAWKWIFVFLTAGIPFVLIVYLNDGMEHQARSACYFFGWALGLMGVLGVIEHSRVFVRVAESKVYYGNLLKAGEFDRRDVLCATMSGPFIRVQLYQGKQILFPSTLSKAGLLLTILNDRASSFVLKCGEKTMQ